MPREIFTFKKQLDVGSKGEALFLKHYGDGASKADGRKFDLSYNGKKVELKTDTYPMQETPNYFMERYGSIEDGKVGGPWRAAQDNVDYFVYFFLSNKTFFWFESKPLVKFLDEYTRNMRGKTVANKGYSSLGYAVPRDACDHLLIRKDKF
jgi:hypothetical protein